MLKNTKSYILALLFFICLFLFKGNVWADYVTIDGKPVTQGQMLIASASMERIEASHSQPLKTDRFILKKTKVEVEITGVIARVRVQQLFHNPYDDRLETIYVFPMPENLKRKLRCKIPSLISLYHLQLTEAVHCTFLTGIRVISMYLTAGACINTASWN